MNNKLGGAIYSGTPKKQWLKVVNMDFYKIDKKNHYNLKKASKTVKF